MATITLRSAKGSALTNAEVDANFTNLNNAKLETSEVVTTATANKLLKLDSNAALPASITGNAATATALATARTIGGVSFNGSVNIDLPGVNTPGNQNTTGNAATATTLQTARLINGISFNGSTNINIPVIPSKGVLAAETIRSTHDTGIYTFNGLNVSLGDSTPVGYWSTLAWGQGAGGSAELAVNWTSGGNELWFRSLRDTTDNWFAWKEVIHSSNYNEYAPTKTGTGASGTWGISVSGSATTLTTTRTLTIGSTGKTFNGSANVSWTVAEIGAYPINGVATDLNAAGQGLWRLNTGYTNGPTGVDYGTLLSFDNASDTGFQIASDYQSNKLFWRSGNPALYGGAGSFGAWRELIHDANYNNYAPTKTGTGASGTWGISVTGSSGSCTGNAATATTATNWSAIPAGTAMLFAQTAAPTGWTKSTTHNDKALRVVSGTAGSGGTVAFSTVFSTARATDTVTVTGSVGATTLSATQMPSHKHSVSTEFGNTTSAGYPPGDNGTTMYIAGSSAGTQVAVSGPVSNTGGNGSHTHSLTMNGHYHSTNINVQYVDVIIATKG